MGTAESVAVWRPTRRRLGFLALFAVSLALRLAFFAGFDVHETLRADAWHYGMLASSLVNRGVYQDSSEPGFEAGMRWPPGYPALLAPFFDGREMAEGAAAALRVQVVVGSL